VRGRDYDGNEYDERGHGTAGGEVGAINAMLSSMVEGASEIVAQCQPVLHAMGSRVYHVGERPGDGQAVKMINQRILVLRWILQTQWAIRCCLAA
jgi:3-hydroxyisobutyrate dehydrogenase-like beta-hydroxyacid dehydrogenase